MSRFEFYQDHAGEWRWRLRDGNHRKIADSGEGYKSRRDCEHGAQVFTTLGPDAPVHETTERGKGAANPGWEYFKGADGQWFWSFQAANGRIIADGAEGYDTEANVKRAIENVKGELRKIAGQGGGGFGTPTDPGKGGGGRFA